MVSNKGALATHKCTNNKQKWDMGGIRNRLKTKCKIASPGSLKNQTWFIRQVAETTNYYQPSPDNTLNLFRHLFKIVPASKRCSFGSTIDETSTNCTKQHKLYKRRTRRVSHQLGLRVHWAPSPPTTIFSFVYVLVLFVPKMCWSHSVATAVFQAPS